MAELQRIPVAGAAPPRRGGAKTWDLEPKNGDLEPKRPQIPGKLRDFSSENSGFNFASASEFWGLNSPLEWEFLGFKFTWKCGSFGV